MILLTKSALITGINGQDGSYLAELLLEKGYDVWGVVRRQSSEPNQRISHLLDDLNLVEGDLTDQGSLISAFKQSEPDEVYNLGAQSFVGTSWHQPALTGDVTGLGVTRMLEATKVVTPDAKFLQASSSEMFGKVRQTPQNELTPFYPRSPYGVAKVYAFWICVNYRESYDMFVSNSICFNHESPRRGIEFVTRKITNAAARIKLGLSDHVKLGNLDAKRDWGHAKDYVNAMYMVLQKDVPEDYIVATGKSHSVRDVLDHAFNYIGIDDWSKHVKMDPRFLRPSEVDHLVGDASKIKTDLGWTPNITFNGLIEEMVQYDLDLLKSK